MSDRGEMRLKRDFLVEVTVIRAWHCTLFLEDTKFLLVRKSLCLICVFGTNHLDCQQACWNFTVRYDL